jgi:hypothetical protein
MAKKQEQNRGEDLVLKSVRFYASDMIYLDWLFKRGAQPYSVYVREAVHQWVEMCRRHGDQAISPSVSVPAAEAEKVGLIPPSEPPPPPPRKRAPKTD